MYRAICAAEKTRVIGEMGEVNGYDMCIRNPVRGNQHGSSSKYCSYHKNDGCGETQCQLDVRPITRSITRDIPRTITTGGGCKEDKNIDRFHHRTANSGDVLHFSSLWSKARQFRNVYSGIAFRYFQVPD